MTALLVGIGNTLRRDDGAGPAVVEQFDCQKVITHQLLPEHAVTLGKFDRVLFVDAAVGGELTLREILPAAAPPSFGHTGDPAWLVGLCETVSGRALAAWLLTVPGHDFGYGEGLSAATRQAVASAVGIVQEWLNKSVGAAPRLEAG